MKRLYRLIIIILLSGCSSMGKISVTNVHDLAAFQENSYIYALPRTRVTVGIVALRHQVIPGPYNAYAEKFLGIKGASSISTASWELKETYLNTSREPDPDQYYSLEADNPSIAINHLMKFTDSGLIIDNQELTPFIHSRSYFDDRPEPLHFTDMSVKRNRIETAEKKTKGVTEVTVDMPVTKSAPGLKTTEKKAEEAANFIIKIRKRRFKLLAGQYEVFPEGTALETSVRELDELEKEYLSLFIGKVYTDTVERVFQYTPQPGQSLERNVICRFSDETGIQDAMSLSGMPIVLELKNMEFTIALRDVQNPYTGPTYENIIYYRVPEKAYSRIFYGSTILLESEIEVLQYGVLVPFSINMLNTK